MTVPFQPLSVTLREVDPTCPDEAARLEAFVAADPAGTPFHRPAWLGAVATGTANRATALLAERGGELVGYLPLIEAHSPLFGRVLVSSGFAVGGGVLATTPRAAAALLQAVPELAARRGCPAAELRGGPLPERAAGWQIDDHTHCTFAASLAADDEAQLAAIPRKQRAEVRKGLAGGLQVTTGRDAAARAMHYAVYAESVRNLGTPVFPPALFAGVLDAFGADADILTVLHHGQPVASVLSLYHRGTVMPYWGGGTRAARDLRANDRMYFELMRHARQRGCTRFDFGRSRSGSGPAAFKRNWGFTAQPLAYARWTAAGCPRRDADPASHSHAAKIAVWRRLPLGLANRLGPWIARGLA